MSIQSVPSIPKSVIDQLFAVDPTQKVNALLHIWPGREVTDYTVSATMTIRDKAGKVVYEQPLHESTELVAKEMDVKTVSSIWETDRAMVDSRIAFASTAQVREAQFLFEDIVYTTEDQAIAGFGMHPMMLANDMFKRQMAAIAHNPPTALGLNYFSSGDAKQNGDSKDTQRKDWSKSKAVLVCIGNHNVTLRGTGMLRSQYTDFATVMQMYKNCGKFKQMMDLCVQHKVPLRMQTDKGGMSVDGIFAA
jgi:hypothetical protein